MNLEWTGHDYVTGEITAVGNVMRGGNDTDPGLPFLMLGGDGDRRGGFRDAGGTTWWISTQVG